MIIYEENGFKQSFKILMSSRGIIIKTHGALSSTYKDMYSRPYEKVGNVSINEKFLITEFMIGSALLKFDHVEKAKAIKLLLQLGKTNPDALHEYIGEDDEEKKLDGIRLKALEQYVDKHRFAKKGKDSQESSQVKPDVQQASVTPPPPPEFRVFALIDGKQEGPYDEQQFEKLVKYGIVDKNSYVWHEGMAEWQLASKVDLLSRFFQVNGNGSVPPPPPHFNS